MAVFSTMNQVFDTSSARGTFILASTVVIAIYLVYRYWSVNRIRDKNGNGIPDGPAGLPIVGSFPFLTHYPELTLDKWAKKYGPLYSVWLGNQLFVIVSDPVIAKDILISKGSIFSSRKNMFIKSQTLLKARGVTASPYGDLWRKHRRLTNYFLTRSAIENHRDTIDREAMILVQDLYNYGKAGQLAISPQRFIGRCSLNNMLEMAFGVHTDSMEDPKVEQFLTMSREFMNCTGPMSNLTDYVALLQHIPNTMVNRVKKLHQKMLDNYGGMIKNTEARMKKGEDVSHCVAKTLLQIQEEEQLSFLDLVTLCGAFMIGGIETTSSIMQWFSALIPSSPEMQAKAHEELDRVIGRDRLPTAEDEANLPFIHGIIKEVERLRTPFWLGTPHMSSEDFTYNGQFIPKNTVMILNAYTLHHDPVRYPDPDAFNPERYINDSTSSAESANLSNPMERDHWAFGIGRRICPGILVAEREIFLGISRMLWAFKMEQVPEAQIDLKEYDGLSGRSPVPFKVRLVPRHENVAKILGIKA
ncbi:hypothetical protein AX17_002400 [Amanita inopinata Kibby_2008]|nr:hypothetical protein AX17_002400 [Amanita inopinata Kibby_2008]